MVPGEEQVPEEPEELELEAPEVGGVDGADGAAAEAAGADGAAAETAGADGAAAEAGEEAAATEGAAASEPELPLPPEEEDEDEDEEAPPQLGPVGAARSEATPSFSTLGPGFGNCTSLESAVVQSLVGILATNMGGKLLGASSRPASSMAVSFKGRLSRFPAAPPVTLTEAQFMYISRFPTLLNHVQANV